MISLIIPMYNESSILPETYKSVSEYMGRTFGKDYEVIFVDDGSTDGSADIVSDGGDTRIRVLSYKPNRGKGCAVRTGVLDAKGDFIIYTDCDLAYGLDVIKQCFEGLKKDPDIIIGSRRLDKDGYAAYPFARKVFSAGFILTLRLLCGFKLSDSQSALKGFKRAAARQIFKLCEIDGFSFDFEVLMTAQCLNKKISEMPVKIINHRESKVNVVRDSFKMLRDIIKIKKSVKEKINGI